MVRMPAFGLEGPWRDRTGFAQTMESVSGMAWRTGREDGPPTLVRGACDPIAGMHTVLATLLALIDRDRLRPGIARGVRHGRGRAQRRGRTGHGVLRRRPGDGAPGQSWPRRRHPKVSTGAAATTAGSPSPSRPTASGPPWSESWASRSGRRRTISHRRQGVGTTTTPSIATWRPGQRHGRPRRRPTFSRRRGCRENRSSRRATSLSNAQLQFRGLFEAEDHPVTGAHPIPMLPFRFLHVPRWLRSPLPDSRTAQRRGARRTWGGRGRDGPAGKNGVIGDRLAGF